MLSQIVFSSLDVDTTVRSRKKSGAGQVGLGQEEKKGQGPAFHFWFFFAAYFFCLVWKRREIKEGKEIKDLGCKKGGMITYVGVMGQKIMCTKLSPWNLNCDWDLKVTRILVKRD